MKKITSPSYNKKEEEIKSKVRDKQLDRMGYFMFCSFYGSLLSIICYFFFSYDLIGYVGLFCFVFGIVGSTINFHKATKHLSDDDMYELMRRLP